jgi:cytochrome b6-f complex iron-sulfur subunit
MAERPSVKDILAAARRGGPAKPADEASASALPEVEEAAAAEPEPAVEAAEPPAAAPAPAAPLGRPLTLKEKLAAARAGGPPPPPKAAAAPPPPPIAEAEAAPEAPAAEAEPAVPAPAPSLGRPLSLKEKLAAARGGAAPAPGAAKPAAPKAAAAAVTAPKPAAKDRVLPPLDKITDPKDLAEALRRTGAAKEKEAKAAAAAAAPPKPAAPPKKAESKVVPPKPGKEETLAAAEARGERRGFLIGTLFVSWIVLGWATFTAAMSAFTLMMARFMYPNVLAEPPSTIKVGLPSNFDNEEVNERWKAEWGFWIVRHGGEIYAIQSVCTHLGCPPNWLAGEQKFKCPCHGSGFYISGINFEGPAPRPLERFKVLLADDGQIIVDKSQKFQQELGQWTDPDSFIKV